MSELVWDALRGDAEAVLVRISGDDPDPINQSDSDGFTVLHVVAMKPLLVHLLPALLRAGANPHATNSRGQTPLDLANTYENHEFIRFFTINELSKWIRC